jgi:manganese transport protein
MGSFVAPRWLSVLAWGIAGVIVMLNGYLLWGMAFG